MNNFTNSLNRSWNLKKKKKKQETQIEVSRPWSKKPISFTHFPPIFHYQRFFEDFRGYKNGTLVSNGLKLSCDVAAPTNNENDISWSDSINSFKNHFVKATSGIQVSIKYLRNNFLVFLPLVSINSFFQCTCLQVYML